ILGGIAWRERDVAGAARHADQVRRLNRAVEQVVLSRVGTCRGQLPVITFPRFERSIERTPALEVESRIREFPESQRTCRRPEIKIAGALPLILRSAFD